MIPLEGDIIEPPEGYDDFRLLRLLDDVLEKYPPHKALKALRQLVIEYEARYNG